MLGDSFRRLQADDLDTDWDRLIRGEPTSDGDILPRIAGKLEAMIPTANPGANARIHRTLFRDSAVARTSTRSRPRSMALLSAPLNLPGTATAKRWWSSPMAAFEAIVACLIIAALALGITAYQSNDNGPSSRSFVAADSSPAPLPTPDWNKFLAMRLAAKPTLTSWTGLLGGGRTVMNLSEVYFPDGTGYSVGFVGVHLVSVLNGSVTITTDSGSPRTLQAGETMSSLVNERLEIHNAGTEVAHIIHGLVYQESAAETFTNESPASIDYYPYFLGNAIIDVPSDQVTISFEIFDETTINRSVRSNTTELFLNSADPVSLVVTAGDVGIRVLSPLTSSEDYRTGGGYDPIAIGSDTVLGRGSTEVLIHPGAMFNVSAPEDSDVLAVSLRVESHPVPEEPATPVAGAFGDSD